MSAPRILAFYQPRHGRIMLCAGSPVVDRRSALMMTGMQIVQEALDQPVPLRRSMRLSLPVPRRHSITLSMAEARELVAALGDAAEDGPSLRRVCICGQDVTFHKDIVAELIDALNEALAMPDHAEALAGEGEAR